MPPRIWNYALMDVGAYLAKHVSNPNKQSAHYAVQSPFEGSNRQIRGKILRFLLSGKETTVEELGLALEVERTKLEIILRQLGEEGFLAQEGEMLGLAGTALID